jgi:butyryl-CoA dehydrogenase
MVARCYACEAMAYRLADYFDEQLEALDGGDPDYNAKALKIIEEYAVETSIMKVFGTETYRLFVDECFQMLGGYGYLTEYHTERPYRDERVNRIYEGTNEINRLLIPGTLMKRQARGRLNMLPWIEGIQASLADGSGKPDFAGAQGPLGAEALAADQLKNAFGLLAGAAAERYGSGFEQEQEVMVALADIAADAYTADSAVHRARAATTAGRSDAAFPDACATYWVAQAWDNSATQARRLAYTSDAGDGRLVGAIRMLTPALPADVVAAGRTIADHVVEAGGYRPY